MPLIKLENCTRCLKCVKDCPSDAIDIDLGNIDDSCIHCGHCVAICPESTVFPDGDVLQHLFPSNVTPKAFRTLSAGIRSCRSYRKNQVDEDTMNVLIENMKHYPSASNARPLEVTVVKTGELVQRLNDRTAETLMKSVRFLTLPVLMPILKLTAPGINVSRLYNYKKRFMEKQVQGASLICHHAPSVMLFHAPVTKLGMETADANIWATYTSIYANTLGLGTCFNGFITNAMERSKSMRKEFNIPPGHQVYAALLIGHPAVKYTNEAGRAAPASSFI